MYYSLSNWPSKLCTYINMNLIMGEIFWAILLKWVGGPPDFLKRFPTNLRERCRLRSKEKSTNPPPLSLTYLCMILNACTKY